MAAAAAQQVAAAPKSGIKARALASGSYTFWKEDAGAIGKSQTLNAAGTTVQLCLSLCDDDASCAAVAMTGVKDDTTATITGCTLISGETAIAQWKRSLTRAVVSRLEVTAAGTLAV
jgi:hypothetical protein